MHWRARVLSIFSVSGRIILKYVCLKFKNSRINFFFFFWKNYRKTQPKMRVFFFTWGFLGKITFFVPGDRTSILNFKNVFFTLRRVNWDSWIPPKLFSLKNRRGGGRNFRRKNGSMLQFSCATCVYINFFENFFFKKQSSIPYK